jgi:CRP-like cAMP-binding protein
VGTDTSTLLGYLERSEFFKGLAERTLRIVLKDSIIRTYERKQVWAQRGAIVTRLGLVLEGDVEVRGTKVLQLPGSGDLKVPPTVLRRLGPYELLGISSAAAGTPLTAALQMRVETKVLEMDAACLREAMQTDFNLVRRIVARTQQLIDTLSREVIEFRSLTRTQLLALRLLEFADNGEVDVGTHEAMGALIGASRNNVCSYLKEFDKAGYVKQLAGTTKIKIVNPEGLTALVSAGRRSRKKDKNLAA